MKYGTSAKIVAETVKIILWTKLCGKQYGESVKRFLILLFSLIFDIHDHKITAINWRI